MTFKLFKYSYLFSNSYQLIKANKPFIWSPDNNITPKKEVVAAVKNIKNYQNKY